MASIVSSSSAPTQPYEASRTEAGPLPIKRGEIGYAENVANSQWTEATRTDEPSLPARHPADRGPLPVTTTTSPAPVAPNAPFSPSTPHSASTTATAKPVNPCLWNKVIFAGFQFGTFVVFTIQALFFSATIVGWAITIAQLAKSNRSIANYILFIHIAFASFLLLQIIFLERRLYRLRAERYSFSHPGEILPSSRRFLGTNSTAIAFAPWNRPPLPTYAVALAQSGMGTGDVEDHLIAAPPPPAYGNTRGSTMLLSGYLRDSLRAQRPVSEHSQMAERHDNESDERPVSYVSEDEQWHEIQDADRARRLEETLARLERPGTRS